MIVHASQSSSFGRLSPRQARVVLAAIVTLALLFVVITLSPLRTGFADAPDRGPGDVELYRAEVDRIAAGEPYYRAAHRELHERGYPTRSVFNWRTPLPMVLIGSLPEPIWGKVLLCGLGAILVLCSLELVAREATTWQGFLCAVLLIGALLPCGLGDCFVMPELWSGVLIALSLALYGLKRDGWAVACGLAALFVRELAAPYCVFCGLLALKRRRFAEFAAWTLGALVYFAFFVWHASRVWPLISAGDIAHAQGWVRFGGAPFVISISQMNTYLLLSPQWVTALYLVAALVGFASWSSNAGTRVGVTAAMYVAAFAIVGQPFNQYWGSMLAPLLCFGAVMSLSSLRDLWAAAGIGSAPQQARI